MWQVLDPDLKNVSVWNRGASSVIARWDIELLQPKFELPQSDLIYVTLNPCMPELDKLHLRFVMSSRPLDTECLKLIKVIKWSDIDRWIYLRKTPA